MIFCFLVIEDEYTGPKLQDGKVTLEFVKELLQFFKDQKRLHRKYAYKVSDYLGIGAFMSQQVFRCPQKIQVSTVPYTFPNELFISLKNKSFSDETLVAACGFLLNKRKIAPRYTFTYLVTSL